LTLAIYPLVALQTIIVALWQPHHSNRVSGFKSVFAHDGALRGAVLTERNANFRPKSTHIGARRHNSTLIGPYLL
jgi:hypothetical protein